MKIKQIRNATLRLEYGGKTFLIDPWLIGTEARFRFVDIPGMPFHTPDPVKERIPMPLFDLPEPMTSVLSGVEYYIVTHIHPDHIDIALNGDVGIFLDKSVPILAQNEQERAVFGKSGFKQVKTLMEEALDIDGVKITKTPALHGTVVPCGDACGLIFEHPSEKILYLAGDTIWYDGVKKTLSAYRPEVIILNACAAETVKNGRLIMNDEDVSWVAKAAPDAKLLISHMDNVAHATITRHSMRGLLARRGINDYFMPEDGETIVL